MRWGWGHAAQAVPVHSRILMNTHSLNSDSDVKCQVQGLAQSTHSIVLHSTRRFIKVSPDLASLCSHARLSTRQAREGHSTLLHPAAKRWLGHQPQARLSWSQSRARPQKNPSAFSALTYMARAGHPTHGIFSSSFIGRPAHWGGPGLGWGGRALRMLFL